MESNLHSLSLIVGRPDTESSRPSSASVCDSLLDLFKFIFDEPRPDVRKSSTLQKTFNE